MGDWLGTGSIAPRLRIYRSFEDARNFARSFGFKSRSEWNDFSQGKLPEKGVLPKDIPTNPDKTYKDTGWKSFGDWLGTGTVAPSLLVYRSFEDARNFARSLGLNSRTEWNDFCAGKFPSKGTLPKDIPKTPHCTYSDKGWQGMGDWLGTGTIAAQLKSYRSFEDARNFARSLGLKNQKEWFAFSKKQMPEKGCLPDDIPATPDKTYKDRGWQGYGDWLGTGSIAPRLRIYRSFEDARNFARSLGLKNQKEWFAFSKKQMPEKGCLPDDIPATPDKTYKDRGWQGYGDWLGTGRVADRHKIYLSFDKARDYVRSLGFKSRSEWNDFCKGKLHEYGSLPVDIPANPNQTYKYKGWEGMGDWLGTGTVATYLRAYRRFEDARNFARSLELKNQKEWFAFSKKQMPEKGYLPDDIPAYPNQTYKNKGWISWPDWLGNDNSNHEKT